MAKSLNPDGEETLTLTQLTDDEIAKVLAIRRHYATGGPITASDVLRRLGDTDIPEHVPEWLLSRLQRRRAPSMVAVSTPYVDEVFERFIGTRIDEPGWSIFADDMDKRETRAQLARMLRLVRDRKQGEIESKQDWLLRLMADLPDAWI